MTILIMNGLGFINAVYAMQTASVNLYTIGSCGELLKYKGEVIKSNYIQSTQDGVQYPVYGINQLKQEGEFINHSVTIKESIKEVGLWRRIINGYPYKSIDELGVNNKLEAFIATEQAIFCYLQGRDLNDFEAIGEAGERTLRAMKLIIEKANNSQEVKQSSTMEIREKEYYWKQDEMDKQYVSKIFYVTANTNIENYTIKVEGKNDTNREGIKITDPQNQEKNQFGGTEEFKILIPIRNMVRSGELKIIATGQVQTKPVFYGVSPQAENEIYAITTISCEEGKGEENDFFPENSTKLTIIKQVENTKERLENIEFEILDENKQVVYSDLKTNQEGKIERNHFIPGKYYLYEKKPYQHYMEEEDLIAFQLSLYENREITVCDKYEEEGRSSKGGEIEPEKQIAFTRKTLPITGK